MWVSAKEMASGATTVKLTKEGSSKTAAAWWESYRNKFTCNGKAHTNTFVIDTVEKGSKGKLVAGKAWVQFCVTTGKTEADTKLILSKSGWVKVVWQATVPAAAMLRGGWSPCPAPCFGSAGGRHKPSC